MLIYRYLLIWNMIWGHELRLGTTFLIYVHSSCLHFWPTTLLYLIIVSNFFSGIFTVTYVYLSKSNMIGQFIFLFQLGSMKFFSSYLIAMKRIVKYILNRNKFLVTIWTWFWWVRLWIILYSRVISMIAQQIGHSPCIWVTQASHIFNQGS